MAYIYMQKLGVQTIQVYNYIALHNLSFSFKTSMISVEEIDSTKSLKHSCCIFSL